MRLAVVRVLRLLPVALVAAVLGCTSAPPATASHAPSSHELARSAAPAAQPEAERRLACQGVGELPSAAHMALVRAFFEARERGEPPLPPLLFIDGRPASRDDVLAWFEQPALFHLADHTPVEQVERPHPDIPEETCTIAAFTGTPSPDCVPQEDTESCEGFEWALLSFDADGRLVALGLGAAG